MKNQFRSEKHERIIYGHLNNKKIDLSAADWMASPSQEPRQGNTFSIYLTGDNYDELKPIFDKLAAGTLKSTTPFTAIHNTPFGVYGQLTDQYGTSWIFRGVQQQ